MSVQPSLLDSARLPRFSGPDVRPSDLPRLGAQLARVIAILECGEWLTVQQIAARIAQRYGVRDPETSISAQARNARKAPLSYDVQRKRDGNTTRYRLVKEAR